MDDAGGVCGGEPMGDLNAVADDLRLRQGSGLLERAAIHQFHGDVVDRLFLGISGIGGSNLVNRDNVGMLQR